MFLWSLPITIQDIQLTNLKCERIFHFRQQIVTECHQNKLLGWQTLMEKTQDLSFCLN